MMEGYLHPLMFPRLGLRDTNGSSSSRRICGALTDHSFLPCGPIFPDKVGEYQPVGVAAEMRPGVVNHGQC